MNAGLSQQPQPMEGNMNAIAKIKEPAENAIVLVEESHAVAVLQDPTKFDEFYRNAKAWADGFVPDTTTKKGRDEITAVAFKITKTRTFIEAARKRLTEDARKQVDMVNAAGKKIRESLEALEEEVSAPLDEWKAVEKQRVADCEGAMTMLRAAAVIRVDDTSESVARRLAEVQAVEIDPATFQEYADMATANAAHAIEALTAAGVRIAQEEADRAELARRRAEDEERQRREAEQRAEAERKEREEQAARQREEAAARAKAEQEERIAAAARHAEEEARTKAEREASEAREAQERAHAEALAAERRRADQIQRDAEITANTARMIAEEKERAEAAQRAEQAKREANKAHQGRVMAGAKTALMGLGVGEQTAKTIVLAIKAGEVPNVSISF